MSEHAARGDMLPLSRDVMRFACNLNCELARFCARGHCKHTALTKMGVPGFPSVTVSCDSVLRSPTMKNVFTLKTFARSLFDISLEYDHPLEVYRVRHTDSLTELADELTLMTHQSFPTTVYLSDLYEQSASVKFRLKSLQVSELDVKNPYQIDDSKLSDTNKFLGFGLVRADKQNRAVVVHQQSSTGGDPELAKYDNLLTEMTFGRCRAECIADFECQSFSVCVRDAKLECIISKVNFREPTMVLQLMLAKEKKSRIGEQFTLTIDEKEKIQVKKFAGCELHNKVYKDLFESIAMKVVYLRYHRLRSVRDRDQCAKLCFDRIIEVLRNDVRAAREASYAALNDPESDTSTVRDMFDTIKSSHWQMCTAFLYLDTTKNPLPRSVRKIVEKIAINESRDAPSEGYCILNLLDPYAFTGKKDENQSKLSGQFKMKFEKYDFDFTSLFEQHQGASLHLSPMEPEVEEAYKDMRGFNRGEVSENAYNVMRKFLETGANIGEFGYVRNDDDCAKSCFLQDAHMWPGCKSFEVIVVNEASYCFFNSITMKDALESMRFDLISNDPREQTRYSKTKTLRVIHYEPKPGLIAGSLNFVNQLEAAESYLDVVPPHHVSTLKIGHFGLFVTVLVALLLGTVSGVMVGRKVLSKQDKIIEDNEKLVEPQVIEFSNLVDFQGRIRDDALETEDRK